MRATVAAPSGPRTAAGSSTWISNRNAPGGRAWASPGGGVRGREAGQRADRALPGGRLQALDPQPRRRRGRPGEREGRRGRGGGGVLLGVAPAAVAVLEVDAQVLDRRAHQPRG